MTPTPLSDETLPVDAHSTPIMDDDEDEDCIEEDEEYPDLGVDELESKSTDTTVNFTLLFMHEVYIQLTYYIILLTA